MSRKDPINGLPDGTRGQAAPVDLSVHPGTDPTAPSPHNAGASTAAAGKPLADLVTREDGWLRITPIRDSGTVFIKWKFTRGDWAGHYVMSVVQYWQMGYGLALLLDKLLAVEYGSLRPTKDTPYPT